MAKKCVHYTNKFVITLFKRKKELQNWLTETCIPKQTTPTPKETHPKHRNSKQRKMGKKKNHYDPKNSSFWFEKS